jgi:hypothetical protein
MSPITDSALLRATNRHRHDRLLQLADRPYDSTVDQLTQCHIDLSQSTGPTTREHVLRFIQWAIKAKLIASNLEVTPHAEEPFRECRSKNRTPSSNS